MAHDAPRLPGGTTGKREVAVQSALFTEAGILTRDLGGAASTEDVTKALIDALNH